MKSLFSYLSLIAAHNMTTTSPLPTVTADPITGKCSQVVIIKFQLRILRFSPSDWLSVNVLDLLLLLLLLLCYCYYYSPQI